MSGGNLEVSKGTFVREESRCFDCESARKLPQSVTAEERFLGFAERNQTTQSGSLFSYPGWLPSCLVARTLQTMYAVEGAEINLIEGMEKLMLTLCEMIIR